MKRIFIILMMVGIVHAHEMVPTYPKWQNSHVDGVSKTTMEMFNKRDDVEWYEIGIFDKDWKPVSFVTTYKIVNIKYLGHLNITVYINNQDKKRAVYVCSKSKIRKQDKTVTAISSRICSKFKD